MRASPFQLSLVLNLCALLSACSLVTTPPVSAPVGSGAVASSEVSATVGPLLTLTDPKADQRPGDATHAPEWIIQYDGDSLTLRGTAAPDVRTITAVGQTPMTVNYHPSQHTWSLTLSAADGTLRTGTNNVVLDAHTDVAQTFAISVIVGFLGKRIQAPAEQLPVLWLPEPRLVDTVTFLRETGRLESIRSSVKDYYVKAGGDVPDLSDGALRKGFIVYKTGTVQAGTYSGAEVLLMKNDCFAVDYPCSASHVRMLRRLSGPLVVLKAYSDDLQWAGDDLLRFFAPELDTTSSLDINPPETLAIPGNAYTLRFQSSELELFSALKKTVAFHSEELSLDVFFDDALGCLVVRNKDGTYSRYMIDFAVLGSVEDLRTRDPSALKLAITWNDGTTNDAYYSHGIFSCAPIKPCYRVVRVHDGKVYQSLDDGVENQAAPGSLEVIGKTANGDDVYREVYTAEDLRKLPCYLTNDYSKCANGTHQRYLESIAGMAAGEIKRLSPQDFYASRPVIYIRDPFGRYLRYIKEDFLPAVECGKPVIYLYPEHTEELSVQVAPNGGISVSEPAYGQGWRVRATPLSALTNLADGKFYGSLFWEGRGINYRTPTRGFVVAHSDIERTLREKLALLGLQGREVEEFLAYWLPRMPAKPWVFLTFVDQATFDTLAPLTISPRPETIIRVFMDYHGLDAPIAVEPLEIRTPVRRGFTVVEWGGALDRS